MSNNVFNGVFGSPFGSGGGGLRAFDVDVLAWSAAVVGNGGAVSLARLIIADQFVYSEKASGAWALTDDYWPLWGESAIQGLTSLKQRRLAIAVNSPTFVTDRHYLFDGVSNYIDTGFIPFTHGIQMTPNSNRLAIYECTNVSASAYAAGCLNGTAGRRVRSRTRSGGSAIIENNSTFGATYTLPVADSRGYTAGSRFSATATDTSAYKNGVLMARTVDAATVGVTLPTVSVYIGGFNNDGAGLGGTPKAASIGFLCLGGALSAGQELAQYNAVQAWATSIGAQV